MKRILILLLIGAISFAAAISLIYIGPRYVALAQLAVADFLLVDVDGPRLGRRPIRDDIVLVLFDQPTATRLGDVRVYEKDVELYRELIKANAAVVYDTRIVAAASDETFAEIQPLLDAMLEINSEGRVMRDIWLSPDLLTETQPRYENLIAQNVVSSQPHAMPSLRARLYPLTHITALGPRESTPLLICREVWQVPRLSYSEVSDQMLNSGISSVWHQREAADQLESQKTRSPYPIGDKQIRWYSFPSTTPLVPPAAFWVSYDPPSHEYPTHSFAAVMDDASPDDFSGKIVIVGFDQVVDPSSDSYEAPSIPGKASAAEVVACSVQTLLDGRMIRDVPFSILLALMGVMTCGLALIAGLLRPLAAMLATLSALLLYYCLAVLAYRSGWYADFALAPAFGLASSVLAGTYSSWASVRSRQRVVDLFGRYVPRAVVTQLMQKSEIEALRVGGVQREVTVLFADIRGFTTFSEDLPPEEVLHQLNALLEVMVACTFENEGTLDKFIGDAILVLFNAPLDQPDHVLRAVRTAVSIQQRITGHVSGLSVGIGVHRGEAIVGNVGTPERMEYTAIGSTVNIASRLCDAARPGDVLVSSSVAQELDGEFQVKEITPVAVKGIKDPLAASLVTSCDDDMADSTTQTQPTR